MGGKNSTTCSYCRFDCPLPHRPGRWNLHGFCEYCDGFRLLVKDLNMPDLAFATVRNACMDAVYAGEPYRSEALAWLREYVPRIYQAIVAGQRPKLVLE